MGKHDDDQDNGQAVKQERPLDGPLATLISEAANAGGGFALTVAKSLDQGEAGGSGVDTRVFRVEAKVPPIDGYQRPTDLRDYRLETIDGLIAVANRYGSKERSLVLFDNEQVVLVVDDQVEQGDRERMTMKFRTSPDWQQWRSILGKSVTHRELFVFLRQMQHTLAHAPILDRMRQVKATAQVKIDSDVRLDGETAGVVFTVSGGDELVKFPRSFEVLLPVLATDVGDATLEAPDPPVQLEIRLEIEMPTEPKQPIRFILFAPGMDRAMDKRVNDELEELQSALVDWVVVRGQFCERNRRIGQKENARS